MARPERRPLCPTIAVDTRCSGGEVKRPGIWSQVPATGSPKVQYSHPCIHPAQISWDKYVQRAILTGRDTVVSNCANPKCGIPLRYLRDGRLFQFEVRALASNTIREKSRAAKKRPLRQVWHYWLCGACCSTMTLQFDQFRGLKIMPLQPSCS